MDEDFIKNHLGENRCNQPKGLHDEGAEKHFADYTFECNYFRKKPAKSESGGCFRSARIENEKPVVGRFKFRDCRFFGFLCLGIEEQEFTRRSVEFQDQPVNAAVIDGYGGQRV